MFQITGIGGQVLRKVKGRKQKMKSLLFLFGTLFLSWCLPVFPEANNTLTNNKNGSLTANKSDSTGVIIPVFNTQTKIVNGSELADVQLKETAEKDKSSKEIDLLPSSVNRTLSRKKKPTDNSISENKAQEKLVTNSSAPQSTANSTIKVVAEGVVMNSVGTKIAGIANRTAEVVKPTDTLQNVQLNENYINTSTSSNFSIKNSASTRSKSNTSTTPTPTVMTTKIPKKPLIAFGVEDIPETELQKATSELASNLPKTSAIREYPNAEPSQELSASFRSNRDYIVPVLTIMFTIPLATGVLLMGYRRFRDYWSTRHYRRMDFLVDGMYNE